MISWLEQTRIAVDAAIDSLLPPASTPPEVLHEAMRYSVLARGKRLRPALVIAAGELAGATRDDLMPAAVAVECVHAFSLIHDDLPAIDNDLLRRGQPTCHAKYGEATAILAGDALFAVAFELLASLSDRFSPRQVAVCIHTLARLSGSGGLVSGEMMDILCEHKPVTADELRFIHLNKTAALLRACTAIGALLANASDQMLNALDSWSESIGLAFQITDDILNITSSAEILGKATGTDAASGKATWPGLFGLEKAQKDADELVARAESALAPWRPESDVLLELGRYCVQRNW